MTNETAQYLILDQVYGWKEDARDRPGYGLATTADGHRQLFPLPGRSSLLLDSKRQENTFVSPSGLAADSKGRIAAVDAGTNQLIRIDPKRKELQVITGIGAEGTGARNFSAPQGVALSESGAIVIADTGNHRVQIFSSGYNLLQTWGRVGADGNPLPGAEDKEFDRPWSVSVDTCGNVYVVDRGNARVQKISLRGKWLSDIGRPCLADPTRLALGPDGLIAIVDPGQQAVVLVSPRRISPRTISVKDPRSAAFDKNGTLYVGDATSLIGVYTRVSADTDTYELIGQGSANVDGEIIDLVCVSEPASYLVAMIKESFNGLRQRLWRIEPVGTFQHEGSLVTSVLDSGLEKCQWHRILMDAVLPTKESGNSANLGAGSVEIESYTSERNNIDLAAPETSWQRCVLTGDDNPDCLVQSGPGRYLWLRVTLRSNGIASPVIKGIKVFYPRISYLQYLPAVYQEDTDSRIFLDRFLSIFQTEFDNFDRQIDNLWQLFDPASVSEKHFDWLASWLGLFFQPDSLIDQRCRFECVTEEPCQPPPECPPETDDARSDTTSPLMEWTIERKRELLEKAFDSYRMRGTVKGLETAIRDHTGAHFATILEHFRLRRSPVLSVIAKKAEDDPCVPPQPPQKGLCGETLEDYTVSLPLDGTVRLWSRAFYKRLQLNSFSQIGFFRFLGTPEPALEPLDWGAHRFTVFFPASPYSVKTTMEKVQQVVEREKPAHTQAELCPVLPRLRVGVQATVGADAVVGGISHLVLNSLSTLNYDAILSCSREENRLRASGTSLHPRTGISTVLS
ncbi:MAG: phage tail protein [Acidobacteria bacterium]|nr:phage tail protein [Acidobacteriota bacterium]